MTKYLLSNSFRLSVGIILGICLVSILAYLLVPKIDRTICYERLSNNLGVPPTSNAIRKALYSDLLSKLPMGLTYDQTISALRDRWHYKIIWRRSDLGGGFKEYVLLDHCYFSRNDFSFLFVFSKEDMLTDILNYIDD